MYPSLFRIGPLTLHSYGLLLALGFLFGLRVATLYARKEGIPSRTIFDLALYLFIASLVGAKVLEIIVNFGYYKADWHRLLDIYQLGGVYYGGLIFAILITIWYTRKRDVSFWQTADVLAMGLAGGQIFGRTGCFLAGCCWGKPASPYYRFAVTFTNREAASQVGTPLNIPLHPVQLYEAGLMLVIFLILVWLYKYRKFSGQQFCLYLFCYALVRFVLEYFRDDPRGGVLNGLLSTSQLISILMLALSIVLFVLRKRGGIQATRSTQ
jgi:phosphatidylglycerol---prolipoprotein diacylglyceryl transferase